MARSYTDYVLEQSRRNSYLQNLYQFLINENSRNPCRIALLDFHPGLDNPIGHYINDVDLAASLNEASSSPGRLLIVEDLRRNVIEILGSKFDIDPLFFACHIYGPYVEIGPSKPSATLLLPSKVQGKNFLSLQYPRAIRFEGNIGLPRKLLRGCNVPRKIVRLPPVKERHIGLSQHGCSVILETNKGGSWLGIILVDAADSDSFVAAGRKITLRSQPFQGGYEDFLDPPSFFSQVVDDGPQRRSLLEDLVYYWEKHTPSPFNAQTPDLLSLAYYPLRIVAAERASYIEVMKHSIKQYEYSTDSLLEIQAFTKLESDLLALQVWDRRCLQTLQKIRSVIKFVKTCKSKEPKNNAFEMIVEDYEHLAALAETYGRRLETMVPVVTSLVQIADTRRSLKEATNITRLTNLALLFVPLSFVTGIFSMNDGVSAHGLKLYFAVAVPLCVVVFSFARLLPFINIEELLRKLRTGSQTRRSRCSYVVYVGSVETDVGFRLKVGYRKAI